MIDGTSAHNYQYCIPVLANECISGSSPGDIYVNNGTGTETGCTEMLPYGSYTPTLTSICVAIRDRTRGESRKTC